MSDLEQIRILVVEVMTGLEDALVQGLPAQSPQSDAVEIGAGLSQLSSCLERATNKLAQAEDLFARLASGRS